ncbi:MAG: hypothetical protein K6347_00555 [Campylobacterales bacterium]
MFWYNNTMLDWIRSQELKRTNFIPRRIELSETSLMLYGPPASGKSALLLDYAYEHSHDSLFIDLADIRLDGWRPSLEELELFCQKHKIHTLLIDNYDGSFPFPQDIRSFVASRDPYPTPFPLIRLLPPDFEESLAFLPTKLQGYPDQAFGQLLREGMLPEILLSQEGRRISRLQELIRLHLPDTLARTLFLFVARHTGHRFTIHQLYTRLKEKLRLSKDKLYEQTTLLEQRSMILACPKLGQPQAPKKLYPYDIGYTLAASPTRDPSKLIETLVMLELVKSNITPYYTDALDFVDFANDTAFLIQPFIPPEQIRGRIFRLYGDILALGLSRLVVITAGIDEEFDFEGVHCDIKPFWTWRLGM